MPFKYLDGRAKSATAKPTAKPTAPQRSYSDDDVQILQEYALYRINTLGFDPKDERQLMLLQILELLRNERDLMWEEEGN